MNRKELFEQALKETGSLVQAVQLVKDVESFIGPEIVMSLPLVNIPLVTPAPESAKGYPHLDLSKMVEKKPHATGFHCKRWTHKEKKMGEAMFDAGKTVDEVAAALGRTPKAIRNSLSNKLLQPSVDPRSDNRRAATLKAHVAFGRKLKDYKEAEKLIDEADKKKT